MSEPQTHSIEELAVQFVEKMMTSKPSIIDANKIAKRVVEILRDRLEDEITRVNNELLNLKDGLLELEG